MKGKKLISLLCAAAMTTSAFAGISITASAADELLTLTDFTAADIGVASGSDTGKWNFANSKQLVTAETDDEGTYLKSTITEGEGSTYDTTYKLPTPITATNYVLEFDTSIHKSNGMGRYGRYNQIAFVDSTVTAVNDPRDYGAYASSLGYGNTGSETGKGYVKGIAASLTGKIGIDGLIVNDIATSASDPIVKDSINVADDQWVRVQSVVNGTTATVTVIDAAGNKIVDAQDYTVDANGISAIHLVPGRGDANNTPPTTQGVVCLDNVHIYTGAVKPLTTEGLRGQGAVQTPPPIIINPDALEIAAPSITVPSESVTAGYMQNFNSLTAGQLAKIETTAASCTSIEGMTIDFGGRESGADTTTYAEITNNTDGDNFLTLASGRFSNGNKGPVVSFANNLPITAATDPTSVMAFNVRLQDKGTAKGQLHLIDNIENRNDGAGSFRDRLAVLTTETDVSGYVNGDTKIGAHLDADKWYTVVVTVTPTEGNVYGTDKIASRYRVFIFDENGNNVNTDKGGNDPVIVGDKVNSGDNSVSVNNLPGFTGAQDKDSIGSGNARIAIVDNIVTYRTTATDFEQGKVLPQIGKTQMFVPKVTVVGYDVEENKVTLKSDQNKEIAAQLVHASYENNALKKIEAKMVKIASGEAGSDIELGDWIITNGDKLMVWNSFGTMVPYTETAYVITNGQPSITPTISPTQEPTATPTPTTEPSQPTQAPTATPTAEPTTEPEQKYTVTITADAGITNVKLGTIEGMKLGNVYTFSNVEAGEYTFDVTYADGYEKADNTPTGITVTANKTAETIASKASGPVAGIYEYSYNDANGVTIPLFVLVK